MKVTVAIDSFKGSLDTFQSGAAVAEAIRDVYHGAEVTVCPVADGGEGTVAAIVSALNGRTCRAEVCGPLGDRVVAEYGVIPEKRLAVIKQTYQNALNRGDTLVRFINGTDIMQPIQDTAFADGVHPGDIGFACIAKHVGDALKELL